MEIALGNSVYKHILLDFDGTIVNLEVDWKKLKNVLFETYHLKHGIKDSRLMKIIPRLFENASDRTETLKLIEQFEQPNNLPTYKLIKSNLLNIIGNFYIISNNLSSTISKVLKDLELTDRCMGISGIDNVIMPKPDKTAFDNTFDLVKDKNLKNYVYIGDSDIDFKFANNLGIDFININSFIDGRKGKT